MARLPNAYDVSTLGGSSGTTTTSVCGRSWQARRTAGSSPKPARSSTAVSRGEGGGNALRSPTIRDPARRASSAAAADARMRNVEAPARFEHGQAARNADGPAVGVRDADHPAAALGDGANAARREHEHDRGGPAPEEVARESRAVAALLGRADLPGVEVVGLPLRSRALCDDDRVRPGRSRAAPGVGSSTAAGRSAGRGAPEEALQAQPEDRRRCSRESRRR